MFPSILLALREGIEIALVIGLVLGSLNQLGQNRLKPALWYGAISAALLSVLIALALNWVGAEFEGVGEQIFEGAAMLLAAGLMSWMMFWMRRENSGMHRSIYTEVQKAANQRGGIEIFLLSFASVMRDGIELTLFLLATRYASDSFQTVSGALLGLAIAAVLGWGIFSSSMKLNIRRFFLITNLLLIFFAAGLIGRGIHEFNEAGLLPAGIEPVWNISALLSEDSPLGQIFTALLGYSSSPSLSMVIGYLVYLVAMLSLFRFPARSKPRTA
jgi:high-affinity iron transporter